MEGMKETKKKKKTIFKKHISPYFPGEQRLKPRRGWNVEKRGDGKEKKFGRKKIGRARNREEGRGRN